MKYILMLCLIVLSAPAWAGPDSGLYDPLPPPGSAFVRFINLYKDPQDVRTNGQKHAEAATRSVTPYFAVEQGQDALTLGPITLQHPIESGKFYTVAQGSEGLKIFEDAANDNPAKAQIFFYNFGPEDMSLKTADGMTDVIADIGPDGSGMRAINAVKVELALFKAGEKVADLKPVSLERGESYSVIYTAEGDPIWVQAETDTLQ